MKARLIKSADRYQLLVFTGAILSCSSEEAKEFLLNFDSPKYYSADSVWDYEGVTIETYRGDTIAVVSDDGILSIHDAVGYRNLINNEGVVYLTTKEYAALHGKQSPMIRRLCMNGRIPGAINNGKSWLIPKNAPYPADARLGRRV